MDHEITKMVAECYGPKEDEEDPDDGEEYEKLPDSED